MAVWLRWLLLFSATVSVPTWHTAKTVGLLQPHLGYPSCMLVTLWNEISLSKLKIGLRNSSTDIPRWWLASTLREASLSWSMVATTHACNLLKQQMKLKQPDNFQNYACTDYTYELWVVTKIQNTKYKTYNNLTEVIMHLGRVSSLS